MAEPPVGVPTTPSYSGAAAPFNRWLCLITGFGAALRIAYVVALRQDAVSGDGWGYHLAAIALSEGNGFLNPFTLEEAANHPPLWTLVLALPALLHLRSYFEQQLFSVLIGSATILLMGLAGRRIASERVGLVAATLAALHPGFWQYERELLSETLMLPAAAVMTSYACVFVAYPSRGRAMVLGGLCGALALIRSEQLLLGIVLVTPLVLSARTLALRDRIASLALAGAAATMLIAPWTLYNLGRFQRPVLLSSSLGNAMVQGNCASTYGGALLGYYDFRCLEPAWRDARIRGLDTAARDPVFRDIAIRYAWDHLARVPVVQLARQGRAWSLYRPFQTADLEAAWSSSPRWVHRLATIAFWALLASAVIGLSTFGGPVSLLLPLLAPFATVIVAAALTFGVPRYRAAAEVPLVLLAAIGIDRCIETRSRRAGTPCDLAGAASTPSGG